MRYFRFQSNGFTLVEVLLVTSLFASIGLAAFTCLSNGLKLWERSQRIVLEEDASIFLDRFTSDIKNTFVFSKIPFKGSSAELSFPTIVFTKADLRSSRAHEEYVDEIGAVTYIFDGARGKLWYSKANYSQALNADFSDGRALVHNVKEVRFRYFLRGEKEPLASFEGKGVIPSGVEVELHLGGHNEDKVLKRFISIPAGA